MIWVPNKKGEKKQSTCHTLGLNYSIKRWTQCAHIVENYNRSVSSYTMVPWPSRLKQQLNWSAIFTQYFHIFISITFNFTFMKLTKNLHIFVCNKNDFHVVICFISLPIVLVHVCAFLLAMWMCWHCHLLCPPFHSEFNRRWQHQQSNHHIWQCILEHVCSFNAFDGALKDTHNV